ncbi:hypothetical protein [Yoonia sp.]|uniref:hypothetical protein n=1 Tax=Yoonia sp. TaxID=2212373 RepID=UPI00358E314D
MPPSDPFFALPSNSEWNACIGRQGDEENYADGYIEAAIELATSVIEKEMYEKRDTLVLPILYNARHSIELNLKLVIGELVKFSVLENAHPKNHDIASHLTFLETNDIPDKLFNERLSALKPFVDSLAQIDNDGQEFRFHENREGQRSMDGRALANIETIRTSLASLHTVLNDLKFRAFSLCDEWQTGTRTTKLSRLDLIEITKLLPPKQSWDSQEFVESSIAIKSRFCLMNRQFSKALNKIQESRGLAGLIGIESDLIYLSDQKAEFLLQQWDKLHPPRDQSDSAALDYFAERDWEAIAGRRATEAEVITDIMATLSEDEFADAETIFYLARDRRFPESYEHQLELKKAAFAARQDFRQVVHDLMSKINFRRCFVDGLRVVGRLALSDQVGR